MSDSIAAASRRVFDAKHPIQDVIRVKALAIVDNQGRNRIELSTTPEGHPMALFLDEKGVTRAIIGLDAGGPSMSLTDESGVRRFVAMALDTGAGLVFLDEIGDEELLLTADGIRPPEEVQNGE